MKVSGSVVERRESCVGWLAVFRALICYAKDSP
jgi:hypothetical protein